MSTKQGDPWDRIGQVGKIASQLMYWSSFLQLKNVGMFLVL